MYFIGEKDVGLDTLDAKTCEKRILLYDPTYQDYFLEFSFAWNTISTPIYTVVLGDSIYRIPSSTYVVCGEAGGETDVIMFEEIIGREISMIVVKNGWRVVEWYIPRIIDVDVSGQYLYPMTNKFVTMFDSDKKSVILTRRSDSLGGTKLEFEEFII